MNASIIDGKGLAAAVRERLKERVSDLRSSGSSARLDAVLIGAADSPSRVYAENQGRTCTELGIDYRLHELPASSSFKDIADRIRRLNDDDNVTAVMLHLPLPDGIDPYLVQRLIAPEKDVEGVNPANIGNIVYGHGSFAPCTALAAVKLIESTGIDLKGKRAVVVGASNVVGKPLAVLLMRQDATVVSCNKWTWGMDELCRSADVLVAAAGVPGLITKDLVKPDAVVVDVGVNRVPGPDGRNITVGDVAFEEVAEVASWVSPVPGGVGPMTVATLLSNVVEAAEHRAGSTG